MLTNSFRCVNNVCMRGLLPASLMLGIKLPKRESQKGFTLIELLVVVAIIAILAVIGISVFAGAQGAARDGRRKSEISSISKSIEAAKDFTSGIYKYNSGDSGKDFPRGLPNDPTSGINYCIQTSNSSTTPPSSASLTTWTTGCPSGWTALSTSISTTTAGSLGATTPDVKSWTVCSTMERSTAPFCLTSLTQ